jgi:hypothetical protein
MVGVEKIKAVVNSKLEEINQKERDIQAREKAFRNEFLGLTKLEKEEFKRIENENLEEEDHFVVSDSIRLLNLEPMIMELKESLSRGNGGRSRNRLVDGRVEQQTIELKTDRAFSQITDGNLDTIPGVRHIDISHIVKKTNESKYYSSGRNSIGGVSGVGNSTLMDNIANNHDLAMLNNNEELLDNISFKYIKTRPDNNTSIQSHMLDFTRVGSKKLMKSIRTNRAFFLLRAKRLEQSMNSSMEISVGDIGGRGCCGRLRKNYDMNISLTSQRNQHCNNGQGVECYHIRSSSLPTEVMKRREQRLMYSNLEDTSMNMSILNRSKERSDVSFVKKQSFSKYAHVSSRYMNNGGQNTSRDNNVRV